MVQRDNWKIRRTAIEAEHWLVMVNECTRIEICGRVCPEPVHRRNRSVNILDTFTINISGRGVDGLCRAPTEQLTLPRFGAMLELLWQTFMGISTETKDFPDISLTKPMEGLFFHRGKSKDRLKCALHIDVLGLALRFLAPWDLTEKDVKISAPSDRCMRRVRATRDEHPGKC